MRYGKTQIFVLALLISACNSNKEMEESLFIYDTKKNALFLEMLDKAKVDYRVQKDGQIFYPVTQKQLVVDAFEKATGRVIPPYDPEQ